MKNLEVKTTNKNNGAYPQYKQNLKSVTTFLRHNEDHISIDQKKPEGIEIQIVQNGKLLFIGDKYELFEILKTVIAQ